MAEEDVQYASVVFKNKKQPQSKSQREEETVYDEVKAQNESPQESSDSKGLLSEKEAERKKRYYQTLACCLGTFCFILVLGITGVIVYLLLFHEKELSELKAYEEENKNLTALNNKLISDNKNLTDQINSLTQDYDVLENKIENLTAKNEELKEQNQKLEGEKKTLKEHIENMEKTQKELNVSRAQWSIDEYCRKETTGRKCKPCQDGWNPFQSSCYAYNDAKGPNQRSWEEAQDDCSGKVSHLTVVANQQEKDYVNTISPGGNGINGYWIGLRAENRTWKWIDGTELTNSTWIQKDAVDGQCVTSLQNQGWKSVSCDQKNAWICEKKALSVE